jgi:hypothetical protein
VGQLQSASRLLSIRDTHLCFLILVILDNCQVLSNRHPNIAGDFSTSAPARMDEPIEAQTAFITT